MAQPPTPAGDGPDGLATSTTDWPTPDGLGSTPQTAVPADEQLAPAVREVIDRLRDERWTVGVIGLGYVGLPLAVAASQRGLDVIGFDIDDAKVAAVSAGHSHVGDVDDDTLKAAVHAGARFTTDQQQLSEADAILVAVPSPLGRNRQPDLSFIEAAAATITRVARPGQLISLESTTYPGTTEDHLLPAVQAAGLTLDTDVFVTFSPERVDPGNELTTSSIPKVVGGVTPTSTAVGVAAYLRLVDTVHPVSTARAAELTKLLENTYRAVNIAMVNELTHVADTFGIDIWEVIDAAASKPFGFQPFYPGPGVGGHCIPLDPQFLAWRARELRTPTRFIDLAEDVNVHMPDYVVGRVTRLLNDVGTAVSRARILGVGAAYKRDVGDDRESPAIDVLRLLRSAGATVTVFDPHVPPDQLARHGFDIVDDLTAAADHDLAIVLTDHRSIDFAELAEHAPRVFDTRGVYRRLGLHPSTVHHL